MSTEGVLERNMYDRGRHTVVKEKRKWSRTHPGAGGRKEYMGGARPVLVTRKQGRPSSTYSA